LCSHRYERIPSRNPSFDLGYRLVQTALERGTRVASRLSGCSRNTVCKWLRRYQQRGKARLKGRSHALSAVPHKTEPEVQRKVLEARDAISCFGPQQLKHEFGLPCSTGAIARILR
jgi:transposase-like protein